MPRRLVIAGLAGLLAAPVLVIEPASAAVVFTCSSVTGSATLSPGLVHDKLAQSLSSGPTAQAADIVLATTSDTGVKANGSNPGGSLSADGTRLAFGSAATNLDPADPDSTRDVYVKDMTTGDIILASTSDLGIKANDDSLSDTSLSSDGAVVAFDSFASNLDPADPDSTRDVYVKDLSSGDISLASTSDGGTKGTGGRGSGRVSLSADGTRVAFTSEATNLDPADPDSTSDIYVKDLSTGDITLASTSDSGVKANGVNDQPALSADGTKVAFTSRANNLDPADTDIISDLFVKDLTTGDIVVASTSDTAVKANDESFSPWLSENGTVVAFDTGATNLDAADTDFTTDVYVKDLDSGDLTLASTSDTGTKGNDQSFAKALSGDGTVVALTSFATNLDPAAPPSGIQLLGYVKDLSTGDLTLASANDAGVRANGASGTEGLSADGTVVLVSGGNATNLDLADTDDHGDLYVKYLPAVPTSVDIARCSNGQSATASIVDIRSFPSRPLGCPESLGGAAGNDYPDQSPILLGANPSLRINWASGPDSFGLAKVKMGANGSQWRVVLVIQSSAGHSTPATNQYLPAPGSGFTKTKLKGRVDWSALDSFDCASASNDPISWLSLVNKGSWIVTNR